ncbi:GSU2403 family nucleotidyltransferase fold protein [Roseateles chitinivorans]|uniref:GSU2403 family nucleotidyltransferase fold protein n=1 Tax=Roseateles chitinivorans TaxID=2917965 RepID=UPI003D669B12
MTFSERDADEAAQIRSAIEVFAAHRDAETTMRGFESDVVWVPGEGGDRLHKVSAAGELQKDFGLRGEANEAIWARWQEKKAAAWEELELRAKARQRMERLNVAAGVGRLLVTPLRVLDVLLQRGIMRYYTVIGTYAMYAYEAAAGVVFDEPTMATNDVDLFLTANAQMKFAQVIDAHSSMVDLLKEVDPTFERNEEQKESATNGDGFSVDFLRRDEAEKFTDAYSISGIEGDIYPAKARESTKFLGSPAFEQVVIAVDGSMTLMRTIDPLTFAGFKEWMSEQKDRETLKRARDKLQAAAVRQLLTEGRLISKI